MFSYLFRTNNNQITEADFSSSSVPVYAVVIAKSFTVLYLLQTFKQRDTK